MSSIYRYAILLLAVYFATGCTSIDEISVQSIYSSTETEDHFVKVDLPTLLNPGGDENQSLELAFNCFYDSRSQQCSSNSSSNAGNSTESANLDDKLTRKRNSVQARLLGASNVECGRYQSRLLRVQSNVDFSLGSLTTLLGTAGAIVSGGAWPQGLSGAAAVSNSVRSSFSETYFRQLAIEQITRAIDGGRQEFLEILSSRRSLPIADYTVEYAVADAMEYHSLCSLIAGLEFSSDAISNAKDPGIKRLSRILENSGVEQISIDTNKVRTTDGIFTFPEVGEPPKVDEPNKEPLSGAFSSVEKQMFRPDGIAVQMALCLRDKQVDGIFGDLNGPTRKAIATFQDALSRPTPEGRGFLDPGTLNAIKTFGACPAQYADAFERFTYPLEKDIKALQGAVGLAESAQSGVFDKATRDKIKEIQNTEGLPETGIVDRNLVEKLEF